MDNDIPWPISQSFAVVVEDQVVPGVLDGDGLVHKRANLLQYRLHPLDNIIRVGHVERVS